MLEEDKITLEIPETVGGWKMDGQHLLEVSFTVVCSALGVGYHFCIYRGTEMKLPRWVLGRH